MLCLLSQYSRSPTVYQKNVLLSSSATELLFFLRIRHTLPLSFLFLKLSFSLKPPPPFSTFDSSMQLHASSSFAPPSFLHNLSHTPNRDLPMHIHVAVMERYPPPKIRAANYTQSKSQGPGVFTLCGDLFSCYSTTYM